MAGKKKKSKVGRKTVDTPDVRRKLEEAAALDATVEEMAYYAGIHKDSVYEIFKKDKKFSDHIQALRQKPILAARQAVVKHATDSYSNAMDYLSRKKKNEFSQRQELTGEDGKDLGIVMLPPKPAQ